MNGQQVTQGRQDGQASERANSTPATARRVAIRHLGRAGKLVAGAVVIALVALLGIAVAPTQDAASARATAVRVDYVAGVGLYDNGWAGGPGRVDTLRKAPAVVHVPYEAGWTLYDDGYAGGPKMQR